MELSEKEREMLSKIDLRAHPNGVIWLGMPMVVLSLLMFGMDGGVSFIDLSLLALYVVLFILFYFRRRKEYGVLHRVIDHALKGEE